ncbi:MAG: hypothetical protein ABR508_09015 [Candidatus Baltobacteraceae bacterium]
MRRGRRDSGGYRSVGTPVDPGSLRVLRQGGRVQCAQALTPADVRVLVRELGGVHDIELRIHAVHGAPFDVRTLRGWPSLAALFVDTANVSGLETLDELRALQRVRLTANGTPLAALPAPPSVRALALHGFSELNGIARWLHVEDLTVSACSGLVAHDLAPLPLRRLLLAHGTYRLADMASLQVLSELQLHDVPLCVLPDLTNASALRRIVLRGVRLLRDLTPLSRAPALQSLTLEAMPQLTIDDLRALRALAPTVNVQVRLGSRMLDREVYRMRS